MSWGFNRSGERFGHALPADGAGGTAPTSDWLLATGYGLRRLVFSRAGVGR